MADTTKSRCRKWAHQTQEDIRIHSEAPPEGDASREFPGIRSHSHDPAEGPDYITDAARSLAAHL